VGLIMSDRIPLRMDITETEKAAARAISPVLWNQPYVYGRGPMHFATGPAHRAMLEEAAANWRRLALAAEICAQFMGDGEVD
jgi:hypothetical protein